jgi:hypothetical protein
VWRLARLGLQSTRCLTGDAVIVGGGFPNRCDPAAVTASPEWWLVRLGLDPFVIDQAATVEFRGGDRIQSALRRGWERLEAAGGTAGWLAEEVPDPLEQPGVDAVLLSTRNTLE